MTPDNNNNNSGTPQSTQKPEKRFMCTKLPADAARILSTYVCTTDMLHCNVQVYKVKDDDKNLVVGFDKVTMQEGRILFELSKFLRFIVSEKYSFRDGDINENLSSRSQQIFYPKNYEVDDGNGTNAKTDHETCLG